MKRETDLFEGRNDMRKVIIYFYELYQSLVYARGGVPYEIRKMCKPPQPYKQRVIRYYARKYGCVSFIETGTWRGATTKAVARNFKELHTVEVVETLYRENCERFKQMKKIHLYCGDSAVMLGEMIDNVRNKKNILFFLDGHYSGGDTGKGLYETPIIQEIEAIFSKLKGYHFVILIDDAGDFKGDNGYPRLEDFVENLTSRENTKVEVKSDIIRVVV